MSDRHVDVEPVAVFPSFVALSVFTVVMRVYVRKRLVQAFLIEDWLCVLALILYLAQSGLSLRMARIGQSSALRMSATKNMTNVSQTPISFSLTVGLTKAVTDRHCRCCCLPLWLCRTQAIARILLSSLRHRALAARSDLRDAYHVHRRLSLVYLSGSFLVLSPDKAHSNCIIRPVCRRCALRCQHPPRQPERAF